ncbi:HalOD1 output domain-containing protein [Halorientalis salina]|uniref:HalOD1 output domain-containing protein n=1 Tax=Halorientalis salina TaxID=2932266 RepID=UPI0010ABA3BC|nr:HalOD1 output domain-containing protein [Halorientalis salina]
MTTEQPRTVQYDWEATEPSTAIVETVAAVKGDEASEMRPLFTTIDPDAVDSLIATDNDAQRSEVSVSLTLAGCEVTVWGHGKICILESVSESTR